METTQCPPQPDPAIVVGTMSSGMPSASTNGSTEAVIVPASATDQRADVWPKAYAFSRPLEVAAMYSSRPAVVLWTPSMVTAAVDSEAARSGTMAVHVSDTAEGLPLSVRNQGPRAS